VSRKACEQDLQTRASLEEIYVYLRKINSHLWRQLRLGVLSGCHALLYTVVVSELGEKLGWRDVNRKAVAALHRFKTATAESERCASLQDALKCVSQKLSIARYAGLQKAGTLEPNEQVAISESEAELVRLSRLLRFLSHWWHSRGGQEGFREVGVYPYERRLGRGRRSGKDRRKYQDANYAGAERRGDRNRRSGRGRRRNWTEEDTACIPNRLLPDWNQ
jgi:hypothetical protein